MKLSKENIESVIPHRQPFIMVDNLLDATPQGFESDFEVCNENVFLTEGILQEPALIENIAQTCAAGFGFLDSNSEGAPRLGFIGAVNKVVVHDLPALGAVIKTKVEVLHQLENIFLVKGENFLGEKILLECEMKIVIN
jgi:3-hydroxyacyl-[acyl-carrier-protein] dehydratase